ncbi:MAG: hypothetical protein ACTSRK_01865 [Promethearchaeota archaeon]
MNQIKIKFLTLRMPKIGIAYLLFGIIMGEDAISAPASSTYVIMKIGSTALPGDLFLVFGDTPHLLLQEYQYHW